MRFLDEAITALHVILVGQPGLVRVRLELARAFFLKGKDSLAREHFERVLAGKPVAAVAANIGRFLNAIRARRRWSGSFGFSFVPDSNVGAVSEEEIIYIHGLPFRRDGEHQRDLGDRRGPVGRRRVSASAERPPAAAGRARTRPGGEYGGRDFDQTFLFGACGAALACAPGHRCQPARQRAPALAGEPSPIAVNWVSASKRDTA